MTTPEDSDESTPAREFTKEELKHALQAFKKRLKLARLDDESRLGYGAMTSGDASGIVGVRAPDQFPQDVWDELVRRGRIKYAGNGMYEPVGF